MSFRGGNNSGIPALLIAPNRELANQLLAALPRRNGFQILADLQAYPSPQALEVRKRQLKPQVILLDLSTDLSAAVGLIRFVVSMKPPVHVVGLHTESDSQTILQSLRAGASEFLYAPFDLSTQQEAFTRIRRLTSTDGPTEPEEGLAIAFASAKPGSGASTLATQTAFALAKLTGKRALLVDCDLTGGTIGFYLKLKNNFSVVDALEHAEELDPSAWSTLTACCGGVDVLPAPEIPRAEPIDPARLRLILDQARQAYDWVILDLPTVFHRTSLIGIAGCDQAFVVSTSELPSLHLTRKAFVMVDQLGFPRERLRVIVNRVDKRGDLDASDMEKLFGRKVFARIPHDYFALHRAVSLGQPLASDNDLGKAIDNLAGLICRTFEDQRKAATAEKEVKAAGKNA